MRITYTRNKENSQYFIYHLSSPPKLPSFTFPYLITSLSFPSLPFCPFSSYLSHPIPSYLHPLLFFLFLSFFPFPFYLFFSFPLPLPIHQILALRNAPRETKKKKREKKGKKEKFKKQEREWEREQERDKKKKKKKTTQSQGDIWGSIIATDFSSQLMIPHALTAVTALAPPVTPSHPKAHALTSASSSTLDPLAQVTIHPQASTPPVPASIPKVNQPKATTNTSPAHSKGNEPSDRLQLGRPAAQGSLPSQAPTKTVQPNRDRKGGKRCPEKQ